MPSSPPPPRSLRATKIDRIILDTKPHPIEIRGKRMVREDA
jgi:hypothetical protein